MPGRKILDELSQIAQKLQREFKEARRVLSYGEYLELFASDPVRHSRDASRYLRDMFEFYGRSEVEQPWGPLTRFKLFDLPFLPEAEGSREKLVGQEAVQSELYRVLANFAREGRPN